MIFLICDARRSGVPGLFMPGAGVVLVSGGLISFTFLTLFILPTLYNIFEGKSWHSIREKSQEVTRSSKRELIVYRRVLADSRTPLAAKIFLGLAVGYLCMPFDLIPDFIRVVGHLDDAVIVPALVYLGLRLIPRELIAEHRLQVTATDLNTD